MKRKLLLMTVALSCAMGTWAYTGVEPAAGRTYFLYNVGANAYFVGTSGSYGTDGNIANATPVTVETSGSNFKLAFVYGGTTYRIYHDDGTRYCDNTSGVEFWKTGSASAYKLVSKHSDKNRYMDNEGWFGSNSGDNNTSWQFISCEAACAEVAEASYVQPAKGWQRVTSVSALQTNPEDYFFAIFSTNATGSMVRTNASNGQGYYVSACSPLSSAEYLFGIENYSYSENDYFVMKAQNTNAYYYPLYEHAYDLFAPSDGKTTADDACRLTFSYSNDSWNIKTWAVWGGSYWGLWDYDHGYQNGEKMAGNKGDSEKGSFLIYRIAKKDLVMTDLIDNPDMETAGSGSGYGEHVKSWNNTGNVVNYRRLANSGVNNPDGAFTNTYCFENWTNASGGLTGQMSQTISSLPNGVYKLQLAALVRSVNGQFIYGKSNGKVYKTDLSGDGEKAYDYTVYVLVEDNQLEIGLDMNNAGADWAAIDNARLTYLISSLPASLTGASGKMNNTVAAAQTTAIAAYNAVNGQTPSNYAAAIEAIANAEASIAAYAKAATYLSSVEAVLATTNFYTPAAYASVYGTYKTAYDAGTLDDATADGLSYKVANYSGTERYDKNTANDLLIPGWTFGGNDASTSGSGFYINSWSTESDGSGDAADFANPFYEYWTDNNAVLSAKTISGTISGLTKNAPYSVTANVRVRQTDDQTKVPGSITMQVGSGSTVDVTAGNQIGSTPRYIKSYTAVGNADSDGKLTLTFTVAGSSNISWLAFRDVNYTRLADDDDYTALNSAITAAEAHTLGFESGEYAPYNNIERLSELANAKAINQEADNTKEMVDASTNALNDGVWTANVGEVNAIYNGDFALSENNGAMGGWVTDHPAGLGGALHARAFVLNSGDVNYDNLAAFGQGDGTRSCAYFRFDGTNSARNTKYTYGSTIGYTMPLKTETIYKLTAQAGGWGQVGKAFKMDVVNSSDASLVAQTLTTPTTGVHAGGPVIDYEMYFVVPANGNYKLVLNNTSGADNAVAVSNIELFSTDALILAENTTYAAGTYPFVTLDRTFASKDRWSTLCVPFAFDKSNFDKVLELQSITGSGSDINMTFSEASTIVAGKPYLVKAKNDGDHLTATNVTLPGASVQESSASNAGYTVNFIGTYTGVSLTDANSNAWVVSNNNLYNVDSNVTVGAYRGYFTVSGSGVKAMSFNFDNATGITETAEKTEGTESLFDLSGRRVSKAQKGLYIMNGKKIAVK